MSTSTKCNRFRSQSERRSWQIELDISAPQILLVEELSDRDASVLLLDFGRLRLANAPPPDNDHRCDEVPKQFSADDDEGIPSSDFLTTKFHTYMKTAISFQSCS